MSLQEECLNESPKRVYLRYIGRVSCNSVLQYCGLLRAGGKTSRQQCPIQQHLLTLHKGCSGFKTQTKAKNIVFQKLVCSQPKLTIAWNFIHESENLEVIAQHKEPYPCLVERQFLGRDDMMSQPRRQKQRELQRRDGGWLGQHSK